MLLEAGGSQPGLGQVDSQNSLYLQLSSHPHPAGLTVCLGYVWGIAYVYFKSQPKDLGQQPLSGDHGPVVLRGVLMPVGGPFLSSEAVWLSARPPSCTSSADEGGPRSEE